MTLAGPNKEQLSTAEEVAEEQIVDRIFEAVIEQRLPAGTKLSESALCQAFGVGRMRIRRSLLLLASREVVELHSNRGAFVARPTAEQAREVFEARLAIEPNVARMAANRATGEDIAALARHLELESQAHANGNRRDAIRLSGQFHTMLAEVAGNSVMLRMIKELVTRTSLIIGIYGAPGVTNCRDDDHADLIDALRKSDAEQASNIMEAHLRHIEERVDLKASPGTGVDLISVFCGTGKRGS
ncbi:GntR family transcriptional regulator [Defluviimonas sp. D31]|uniref:GntR family transcriptional regulator n=1 Tax=Defluviimonas sp. D31 TaxID=3083253 RepID=UPI00296EC966|nr:GntR family transcriptional regulator [Defluviimonas sp. D31]MDW4551435.1 GntR family transcriptional regulator [Defluviimonas sp. D31]